MLITRRPVGAATEATAEGAAEQIPAGEPASELTVA
jgi:hypothetical protein